ncbi:hypothetical protein niasHT_036802 [Heterodera trifolii]|uniref:MATH domain-containing protein n=1 Tax=Heterodera trifolii TaxID=157864 RepID=A0ABD2IUM9_9BILA
MQFQINGRISDWKKGTLLMNIEKVSEFAREEFESNSNFCCISSATFRIVSRKNWAENSVGTLCDHVFYKSNNRGFGSFISFAKLMDPINGFYNREEDKVTLVIDVIVKNEKSKKFVSDPSKSNGTISMEIEKVSEFAREIIGRMEITDNEKWLGIYLLCDAPKEENWNCKCSAIIRIVSQKSNVTDLRRELDDDVFD